MSAIPEIVEKRPSTAYFAFASEVRLQHKIHGSVTEQAKQIGQLWHSLSDEEKKSRQETQKSLIDKWKSQQIEVVKPTQTKLSSDEILAFQLFCNLARTQFFKEKNSHLVKTKDIENELRKQFEKVKDDMVQVSIRINEKKLKGTVQREYFAWDEQ